MNVKILVDGGCDISKEKLQDLDIEMLPMLLSNEEQVFEDGEISVDEMFERMKAGEVFMTSQVATQTLIDGFEKYASQGRETIYISLSSGITATYDSAKLIAQQINEKYGEKIYVFDSQKATAGLGYVAQKAAELAKKGASVEKILKLLEFYREHLFQDFTVTSLEFLTRGGRVSKTEAAIGGLLNIRPLLRIEPGTGKLKVFSKVRGEKAMIKKLLERINPELKNPVINIIYGENNEVILKIKEAIATQLNMKPENILIEQIGPIIGAHVGPDIIAITRMDVEESELKLD